MQASDPIPVGSSLECGSDFYSLISINFILQEQGWNPSPPINFPWLLSLPWLQSKCYMWKKQKQTYSSVTTLMTKWGNTHRITKYQSAVRVTSFSSHSDYVVKELQTRRAWVACSTKVKASAVLITKLHSPLPPREVPTNTGKVNWGKLSHLVSPGPIC